MQKLSPVFLAVGLFFAPYLGAENATGYFEAKNSIKNGGELSFYSHLSDHPLYPYLAADFYRRNLDRDSEITSLFQRYYAARPIKKLHNRWIEEKYNQGDYAAIAKHYYHTGNEEAECAYRSAQLILGNREAALKDIYTTWLSKTSVSPLCDSVFAVWDGINNPEYRVKRTKLAYRAGNAALAEQLAMRLPDSNAEKSTLLQFARYHRYPEMLLSALPSELTSSALARELLPGALKQLIRIDSSSYATFAMQFADSMKGNDDYQAMLGKLTEYLAKRDDPQAKRSFALMSKPNKDSLEAVVRYLATNADWQGLLQLIKPDTNNAMALYWLGRASEASGKNAVKFYQKAAQTRSYYGFLAADKIGAPYQFNKAVIAPEANVQQSFNRHPGLERAKLLRQYGEPIESRREIINLANKMPPQRKRQLALWLNQNRFYFEAIYLLGQAKDWNDIDVRFPTPYNAVVKNASRQTGVDVTWIYAIMRQESSMDPRAYSRAKAQGLMQLIPGTARRMARQQGLSLYGGGIYDPVTNTQLGAAYLADMFARYGNIVMASAAYNAGPGRVERWIDNGIGDMTVWIEKIPFKETRKYVKNILEYQQVYARHLGITIPTVTRRLTGRYQAVK